MDRLIYTAMTGAAQALEQQSVVANNLANASTTGFRAQLAAFRSVPMTFENEGADGTTRTFVLSSTPAADYTPGPIQQTGNPLDVAIQGPGWLSVQAADGSEAYTRAGNLHVDQNGQLVTANNLPVLGNGGPLAIPPGAEVTIGKDGTVSALIPGDPPTAIAIVDQLKLVNPEPATMSRGDDGLFRTADGDPAEADHQRAPVPDADKADGIGRPERTGGQQAAQLQLGSTLRETHMNRSLYIAATGMNAQQAQMDVISNNLANVSTNGFKGSRAVFEDLLYQTVRQPGANSTQQTELASGSQLGTGVQQVATERLYTQGNLQQTGNSKDVAINGQGFFQVTMPDGTTSYTRDGSFQTNAQGQLVTSSGYQINPAITIPQNATSLTIGSDGTVSIMQPGSTAAVQVGALQLATFINPAGLEARGENLFTETGSSGAPNVTQPGLNGAGSLQQGYVEASNVNVVQELVNMIQTQRAYEINSKAVTTSDQMLQTLSNMQV
jgi:flagellar basal-body rod protein FlgG